MVVLKKNVMARMRDGILLAGDLYRPDTDEQYPVVIMRTPYNKNFMETCKDYSNPYHLAGKGYNVLIQDVRGCYQSQGVLKSTGEHEIFDGYDTVEWAAQQPWSNGKVGMYGLSYFGYTQLAAAEQRPPHLVAICPFEMSGLYPFSVGKTCTMNTYHLMWLYSQALGEVAFSDRLEEDKEALKNKLEVTMKKMPEMMKTLPLREIPAAYMEEFPLFKDFVEILDHIDDPEFKKRIHNPLDFSKMDVAMLHCAGWYDSAHEGVIDNFEAALKQGTTDRMKKGQKLILGPWVHGGDFKSVIDHVDFGEHASGEAFGLQEKVHDWFDYWLKGKENGIMQEQAIDLFVMGVNQWRKESEWPLARTNYTDYFLHSQGHANTLNGDGSLSKEPPLDEKEDCYTYNPLEPTPSQSEDYSGAKVIQDLSEVEQREDILVYQTDVLKENVEVTGHITLQLYVQTNVEDTDFICKLLDIHPDGKRYALTNGVLRCRYRHSLKPSFLEPNKVYELMIEIGTTSNVFLKGHRIGLEIASSDFPKIDRNLNTTEAIGAGTEYVIARHKILHSSSYPSKLILPII